MLRRILGFEPADPTEDTGVRAQLILRRILGFEPADPTEDTGVRAS